MSIRPILIQAASLTALTTTLLGPAARGQAVTQTFALQSGWNALHLEVEPTNPSPASLFSGLPVSSVWTRSERLASAEFIQDPSEAEFNRPGWLVWFPPGRPEAFLGNLFAIHGHRAYLVKLTNSVTAWSVAGRPSLRRLEWVPDAYNLRGFPVDSANPPTFQDFFRSAKAHYDAASGQLENIYRLNAAGQWTLVAPADRMRRGEACWVFSRGASDFAAPLEVVSETGDGVDFGAAGQQFTVEFSNRTAADQTVTVQLGAPTASGALAYRVFEPTNGYAWPTLPATSSFTLTAGSTHRMHLAIRRGALPTATYSARLEISDHAGTVHVVPVSASLPSLATHPLQGLWVGGATLNGVGEVNGPHPTQPTATPAGFPLRLLVHVDAQGRARFLKEVIQMWKNGTYTNDAQGNRIVDKPGEYVLLTDDRLIGQFEGSTMRDGVPVGRRLSTAGFDFEAGPTNCLAMSGAFAVGNRLTLTIPLPPSFPTNPYRHKYHPDHDNLDARFVVLTNNLEAYSVTRDLELEFSGSDPGGASEPDFGYSAMGGVYRETLTGLHKNPIRVEGTFRLTRAAWTGVLNPSPNP